MGKIANLTAHESAARVATNNSADLFNEAFKGCHVIIDMTASAVGDVTFKLQGKDELSGKYYDLGASAAIGTVSTNVLKFYPAITPVANLDFNQTLPRVIRVVATHSGANSFTYSTQLNMLR